MDLLKECALSFQGLLEYEYHFVIGRKGQLREFRLGFDMADYLLEGKANQIPSYLFLGARNHDEKEQMCRTFFQNRG